MNSCLAFTFKDPYDFFEVNDGENVPSEKRVVSNFGSLLPKLMTVFRSELGKVCTRVKTFLTHTYLKVLDASLAKFLFFHNFGRICLKRLN